MKENFKRKLVSDIPKKKCRYCFSEENLTYDHKTPLVNGGKNEIGNIQVLCRRCNGIKSSYSNGTIFFLSRWLWEVNQLRIKKGKTPLGMSRKDYDRS